MFGKRNEVLKRLILRQGKDRLCPERNPLMF